METTQELTRTKWSLDPSHSQIGFKVKHLMVTNVRGVFNEYTGSINTEGDDFKGAEIDLSINTASVSTADFKRCSFTSPWILYNSIEFDIELYCFCDTLNT